MRKIICIFSLVLFIPAAWSQEQTGRPRNIAGQTIRGYNLREKNIIFSEFPVQHDLYQDDTRAILDTVVKLYGNEEWKANVLTSEIHGHLGVFSVVGAKMGIRAREMFGVGPDMLDVVTYAGSVPPYSCLNDGLQVSTGATLGMGTIRLAEKRKARPSAIFTFDNRSVRITLKDEYLQQVDADIREGIMKYGLKDDSYWNMIRKNALKYWVEWDRNKIFNIEEISVKK